MRALHAAIISAEVVSRGMASGATLSADAGGLGELGGLDRRT